MIFHCNSQQSICFNFWAMGLPIFHIISLSPAVQHIIPVSQSDIALQIPFTMISHCLASYVVINLPCNVKHPHPSVIRQCFADIVTLPSDRDPRCGLSTKVHNTFVWGPRHACDSCQIGQMDIISPAIAGFSTYMRSCWFHRRNNLYYYRFISHNWSITQLFELLGYMGYVGFQTWHHILKRYHRMNVLFHLVST